MTSKAGIFRSLHAAGTVLVLPNVWDVIGARLVVAAGAAAVATTSGGVAWSLGVPDGNRMPRDRAVDLIGRVAAAVDVPVSADIEAGYGETPADVADTVRRVVAAGAVGVNLEDGTRTAEGAVERFAAARAAADPAALFLNARVDTFLLGSGTAGQQLAEAVARARGYRAAGADGIFVPGVTDPDTIAALAAAIDAPLNVMAGPGAPPVARLAALGVARVSVGTAIAESAYALVRRAATELLSTGTYTTLADTPGYPTLNALLS